MTPIAGLTVLKVWRLTGVRALLMRANAVTSTLNPAWAIGMRATPCYNLF